MEQWEFSADASGRWSWRCVDAAAERRSEHTFASRTDCIADAMRNGYLDVAVTDCPHQRRRSHASRTVLGVLSAYTTQKSARG